MDLLFDGGIDIVSTFWEDHDNKNGQTLCSTLTLGTSRTELLWRLSGIHQRKVSNELTNLTNIPLSWLPFYETWLRIDVDSYEACVW